MPVLDLTASSVDLTRAICDIPSVSGDEATLADAIFAAISPLEHLDVYRDGDTIVARTHLGRAQRVAIAGHIDTVPINANLPTRDIEIDGEPISGVAGPWT
jgi:succinyl-diaminopimelate desuccinylase